MTMARVLPAAIVAALLIPSFAAAAPPASGVAPAAPAPAAPAVTAAPAPSPASAPGQGSTDPSNAEAREHYQRGIAYYKEGDFKLSLLEFRRAYDLSHNHRILYNLGRVHEQLNDYAQALISFEQYLREGGATVAAERRDEVMVEVADLRGKTAHVEISVDVASADVFVDGVPIGKSPLVAPILLDAGDHRIEVQRSGYESARRFVTLAARDSARLAVHLDEIKARVVVSATGAVESPKAQPRSAVPAWIAWSTTGALAVGAGVTGLLASSKANQLNTLVASPTSTADQRASLQNQARGLAIASDVLAATAVVAGGFGLYFTLRPSGEGTSKSATLSAGLCGTGVCAAGRF
ncbi:MAG TPA: PEGA domain-containing protein [Polyangiaceae bacterium]